MKAADGQFAVQGALEDGESVEFVTAAQVGQVSKKRQLATTAIVGVATLGTVVAHVQPKRRALVLTDRRLMFFELKGSRPTSNCVGFAPRGAFRLEPRSSALLKSFDLVVGGDTRIRLNFGGLPGQRRQADELAARVKDDAAKPGATKKRSGPKKSSRNS